ncbi:type II toxin-antitoxin system RelE/ParE family toxin [uncultured Methylobacterium sp.]|jgi:putative addiction module killer protein|uniref:type II toxin-antitoxin system RelE/ParE family toxin n=1 Tax=uncultured Methylobacterium sp. TaxID=157278 RepID=UPI0026216B12|nr:type II toxin-antitoxin system RelE/ParE family toxin [uncultured Methylobacterium sp.]
MFEIRRTALFSDWLDGLRDRRAAARIIQRIQRVATGNLGDAKSVGGGVSELRVDHGPGYRLYFVQRDRTVVVLLCGGDKSGQQRDIQLAKSLAENLGGERDGS